MRAYILKAIIKRDFKELLRNPQTLIILSITLGMNVLLTTAADKGLWFLTLAMCLVFVGFYLTSFMITEEKEKKTLEALLVSPAKYNEVLFGKLFLTFLITSILSYLLVFVLHYNEISILHTIIVVPLGAITICLIGVVIGLICHTQAMLSGIGTLLMLLLFMPEVMAPLNVYLGHFARALPTHHIIQIADLGKEGFSSKLFKHYSFLLLFLVVITMWVRAFISSASAQEGGKWQYSMKQKIMTIMLLITCLTSSYFIAPATGVFLENDQGLTKYENKDYKISLYIDKENYTLKEYLFKNKILIKFTLNDSEGDYLYISIKENEKKLSFDELVDERIKKIKGDGVLDFDQYEFELKYDDIAQRFSYHRKGNRDLFYIMRTDKNLFKLGIDSSEKNFKKLEKLLTNIVYDFNLPKD